MDKEEDKFKYSTKSHKDTESDDGYEEDFIEDLEYDHDDQENYEEDDEENIDNIGYIEGLDDLENIEIEDEYIRQLFSETMNQLGDSIRENFKIRDRMWKPVKKSFSLEYLLSTLTKKELLVIAERLEINKVSNLKKENLINRIAEEYEEKLILALKHMDIDRFRYLLKLTNSNGYKESDNYIDIDDIYYFREFGIAFTGRVESKYVIIMPEKSKDIILRNNTPNLKRQLKRNEEMIKLFWGMCHYYGIMDLDNFKKLVTKYVDYDISDMNLRRILKEAVTYYDEFEFDEYVGNDILVRDISFVLGEQSKRPELDYYPFTKEELLEVTKMDYMDNSKAYKDIYKFLIENFDINSDDLEELIFEFTAHIKNNGNTEEVISEFSTIFDIDDIGLMKAIVAQAIKYANNIRHWILKGYTPQEVNPAINTIVKGEKVGRNDPCPCGSGKKYKRCCGSKVIYLNEFKK